MANPTTTPLVLGDLIRSQVIYVKPPTGGIVVWWWRVGALSGNVTYDVDVAEGLDSQFSVMLKAVTNNGWIYKGWQVQVRRGLQLFPMVQGSGANAGNCTLLGDVMPDHLAQLIRWKTQLAGRNQHGRSYFPPATEVENDASSQLVPAHTAKLTTIGIARITPVVILGAAGGSATLQPVLYHRKDNSSTDIHSYQVAFFNHVQRRRAIYTKPFQSPWVNVP